MLNVSRSRSFWMLMLIIAVARMGETQGTESEAQVNSIKSPEPQTAAANRSSGVPKTGNIPAQVTPTPFFQSKLKPFRNYYLPND